MRKVVKVIKVIVIVLLIVVVIGLIVFGIYFYKNTHWVEKDQKRIKEAGVVEKKVTLPNGNVINYGETNGDGPALLLIHGQMGEWEDYACVLPELSKKWHVYAIDVYGHGESSHKEELYYLDKNGDDLIWFINNVICEKTVVSGHSNGAITAAYIGAYGGDLVAGVVLEDPPIFSTQGEGWEQSFAYLDTYKVLHEYNKSDQKECWVAYYLRNCLWGKLYMSNAMNGIANYAQKYHEKHPGEEVKIGFLPKSITAIFHYVVNYDMKYGEHFYDLTWNNGFKHEDILSDIKIPCVYLHAKESQAKNGTYTCAATKEQAERAVKYIGDNCTLVETTTSDHLIHSVHKDVYLDVINGFLDKE
ncbi:MAG: alpha/beta hydrolase [Clostridiales bacterium]|nr:alpha/beta hydrolase [Clostridiales bacterium]